MTQSTDFIEHLAALAQKATPGDWRAARFSSIVGSPITAQPDPKKNTVVLAGVHGAFGEAYQAEVEANAALIVLLHNSIPAILALGRERDALAIESAWLRETIRDHIVSAFIDGATQVHNHWAAGNVENDPDFTEAAYDYAASIAIGSQALEGDSQ